MSKKCCVCGDVKDTSENVLYTCKGHGCDVIVHQGCYGIVNPPTGLWFCRKCESQERAARVRCELCPKKEGALKRTDTGGWAHIVCALYIPEATFGNNERMEPIVTSKLPKERFSKPCYICEEAGLETQAVYGACMSCHKSSCRMAFHVTCAQREELLCEEKDSRDPHSILYCGYCALHFKKMNKQKYKQSLRKPLGSTPTTTVPPFSSPLSDLSPSAVTTPLLVAPNPYNLTNLTSSQAEQCGTGAAIIGSIPRFKKEKRSSLDSTSGLPPTKRKRRRRVSSSNESTTSDTHSYVSDPHMVLRENVSDGPALTGEVVRDGGCEGVERMPYSPVTCAQVSLSEGVEGVARPPSSSTSSEQSLTSRSQLGPPRSLQELLERQWEQTAQFILDKVGKQNNVGSMLAHLHTLQSENRQMQSKIMELASQREFYIAINTKLRQTLAEHETIVNRPPNGIRDNQQQLVSPDTPVPSPQMGRHRMGKRNGANKNRVRNETDINTHLNKGNLSKETQDSLLKAHFSTSKTGLFTEVPLNSGHYPRVPPQVTMPHNHSTLEGHERKATTVKNGSKKTYQAKGQHVVDQSETVHEITKVTNSVQAPISTFAPLPKEGGVDTAAVRSQRANNIR